MSRAQINFVAKLTAHDLSTGDRPLESIGNLNRFASQNCQVYWFIWLAKRRQMDDRIIERISPKVMQCSGAYIQMMRRISPENIALATEAVYYQPNLAESWFWLADLSSVQDPELAIDYFEIGLEIDPLSGRNWIELGRLLESRDQLKALEAFLIACHLDDPGKHGCYGAGRVAEKIGDLQNAMAYYRLSTWPPVREKADRLEESLKSNKQK